VSGLRRYRCYAGPSLTDRPMVDRFISPVSCCLVVLGDDSPIVALGFGEAESHFKRALP
jgi:hypothetical protein